MFAQHVRSVCQWLYFLVICTMFDFVVKCVHCCHSFMYAFPFACCVGILYYIIHLLIMSYFSWIAFFYISEIYNSPFYFSVPTHGEFVAWRKMYNFKNACAQGLKFLQPYRALSVNVSVSRPSVAIMSGNWCLFVWNLSSTICMRYMAAVGRGTRDIAPPPPHISSYVKFRKWE